MTHFGFCQSLHPNHPPQTDAGEGLGEGRWRAFTYEELIAREKSNLDIFWLRDES